MLHSLDVRTPSPSRDNSDLSSDVLPDVVLVTGPRADVHDLRRNIRAVRVGGEAEGLLIETAQKQVPGLHHPDLGLRGRPGDDGVMSPVLRLTIGRELLDLDL